MTNLYAKLLTDLYTKRYGGYLGPTDVPCVDSDRESDHPKSTILLKLNSDSQPLHVSADRLTFLKYVESTIT